MAKPVPQYERKLMLDLLAAGWSAREAARLLNISRSAVLMRMKAWRVKEHLPVGGQKGKRNGRWKSGREVTDSGYVKVCCPNHPHRDARGHVFEHRLVMEMKLGRYLLSEEVVHHKDYDRRNNRIENLELFPNQKAHVAWHIKNDPAWQPVKDDIPF
jgi:transposase